MVRSALKWIKEFSCEANIQVLPSSYRIATDSWNIDSLPLSTWSPVQNVQNFYIPFSFPPTTQQASSNTNSKSLVTIYLLLFNILTRGICNAAILESQQKSLSLMLHGGGVVSHREFGYTRLEVELLGEGLDSATLATLDRFQCMWASVPGVTNSACKCTCPGITIMLAVQIR